MLPPSTPRALAALALALGCAVGARPAAGSSAVRAPRPAPAAATDAARRTLGAAPPPLEPMDSLHAGRWVKLICGASNQDVPSIRNLALLFTLSGVDCIDLCADEAVLAAAEAGVSAALELGQAAHVPVRAPWLMLSIQDGEDDVHFRKATFDASACPPDCPRPCVPVCPADAILDSILSASVGAGAGAADAPSPREGVLTERCYGCGRCVPVCPYERIGTYVHVTDIPHVRSMLGRVDALEIHTRKGRGASGQFAELWDEIGADAARALQLLAISTPDLGEGMGSEMRALDAVVHADGSAPRLPLMWQLDGRPMSGDVGKGASAPAVELAARVISERPVPLGEGLHFASVAGGANAHTAHRLAVRGLLNTEEGVHGVAFGSYARRALGRVLAELPDSVLDVEQHGATFERALERAHDIVMGVKHASVIMSDKELPDDD